MDEGERQISMVTWQDAAFSFEKLMPSSVPEPRITFGVIIREAGDHIFIATNLYRDKKTNNLVPVDGMLIPRGVIREVKQLSKLHD